MTSEQFKHAALSHTEADRLNTERILAERQRKKQELAARRRQRRSAAKANVAVKSVEA